MYEKMSLQELVEAVRRGDSIAFDRLMAQYRLKLESVVAALLPQEFQNAKGERSAWAEIMLDLRRPLREAIENRHLDEAQPLEDAIATALIALVRQHVFAWLTRRCQQRVLAIIERGLSRYLRQQDVGPDIWNEALQTAWEKYRADFVWKGEEAFVAWLGEIAEHKLLDRAKYERRGRRDHRRRIGQPEPGDSSAPRATGEGWIADERPSTPLRYGEQSQRLQELMQRLLSASERLALHLFYFESLSCAEVAEAIGTTVPYVKNLLWSARRKLQGHLQGSSWDVFRR